MHNFYGVGGNRSPKYAIALEIPEEGAFESPIIQLKLRFSGPGLLLLRSELFRRWNPGECQLESERVLILVDTKENNERYTLNNLKSAKWNTKYERERQSTMEDA